MHDHNFFFHRVALVLYDLLISAIGLFGLLPYMFVQLIFGTNSRQEILERLGFPPNHFEQGPYLCLHAVSVGEVNSIEPLLRELEKQDRERKVILTVGNREGRARGLQLKERYTNLAECMFLPWDYSFGLESWFRRIPVSLMGVVETEIWPGLYRTCQSLGVPLVIINGRIYSGDLDRYRRLRWFFAPLLAGVSWAGVQSEEEAERFRLLGVPGEKIDVVGSTKYDAVASDVPEMTTDSRMAKGPYDYWIVAGSTHLGEEEIIAEAFRRLATRLSPWHLKLVLAPRHVSRATSLQRKLWSGDENSRLLSRTLSANWTLLIVDEIGALKAFYRACNVAILGGTLVDRGGHNLLEAIHAGCPVLIGPYFDNFELIVQELLAENALSVVRDEEELASAIERLLTHRDYSEEVASRAIQVVERHSGRSEVYVSKMLSFLS